MARISLSLAACGLALACAGLVSAAHAQQPPRPSASASAAPRAESVGVQIVARTSTRIGASMAGRLVEFPLRDGDRFAEGDLIARFRCEQQTAQVAHAQAQLTKHNGLLARQRQLRQLGTYSAQELQVAEAESAAANADLANARAVVADCVIRAPFAGRVSEVQVRNFQSVAAGAPMIDLLNDADLESEMVVPSAWLSWLEPGRRLPIRIAETGRDYEVQLSRISGRVDPVSRTVKVYATLVGSHPELLPGMSGVAAAPDNVAGQATGPR